MNNIVILVIAFWGARLMRSFFGELMLKVLPSTEKKGLKFLWKVISLVVGWGAFLLYVYFAGYYIMGKEANTALALIIALVPNVAIYGYKLFTRAAVIE